MEVLIGAGSVVFGMLISYLTFMRGRDKEIKTDVKEKTEVSTKLDHISEGVDGIKIEMRAEQKFTSRLNENLIRVDESAKSAHKRIDKLEGIRK